MTAAGVTPVGLPQFGQRDHDGPQRGLHDLVVLQRAVPHHVQQRPVRMGRERLGALGHPAANTGEVSSSSAAMPTHGSPGRGRPSPPGRRRSGRLPGRRAPPARRAGRRRRGRPPRRRWSRAARVVARDRPTSAAYAPVLTAWSGAGRAGRRGPGRSWPTAATGPRTAEGRARSPRRPRRRGLLEDGVGVGAAHAERRLPGPARPVALGPRHQLGQRETARRPTRLRGRLVDVQGLGQDAVAQRHAPS